MATRKRDDDMFADDDDLGGLLDSPGRSAPIRPSAVKKKDGGIMDDLLGKDNVDRLLQKPGNGGGADRQFKLDKKYTKSAGKFYHFKTLVVLILTLKALARQWVALDTAILQSLRSIMLKSVSPFFFISILMVAMYLNVGLPLGLAPTSTSSTVLVI